jgi:hypothetical protein
MMTILVMLASLVQPSESNPRAPWLNAPIVSMHYSPAKRSTHAVNKWDRLNLSPKGVEVAPIKKSL